MMQTFTDNRTIKKANLLKKLHLYPFFRSIFENNASTVTLKNSQHQKHIMISSNNYLGLTHHPYVQEAAIKAIEKYGTGCTGSRFLNGNFSIHEELEEKLAEFIGHEKALVYSTGMQVNLGSISALCGPRDCFLSDMENHASIIDAHRLSLGSTFKFKHNDMEELEKLLQQHQSKYERITIITDGVFSMTGRLANLPEIVTLAKKYGAFVYVDDAHGLGVLGKHGRGTAHHYGLTSEVHFNMGTFSKSFASIGGFISGSKEGIDYIKHLSRTFMFSAALPPSAVATALACLELIQRDESIIQSLWDNVQFMLKGYSQMNLDTMDSQSPIIPILIGDEMKAMQITMFLEENGIFATPVIPPATSPGMALIRTSFSSAHSKVELQYCLDIFAKMIQKFELH